MRRPRTTLKANAYVKGYVIQYYTLVQSIGPVDCEGLQIALKEGRVWIGEKIAMLGEKKKAGSGLWIPFK